MPLQYRVDDVDPNPRDGVIHVDVSFIDPSDSSVVDSRRFTIDLSTFSPSTTKQEALAEIIAYGRDLKAKMNRTNAAAGKIQVGDSGLVP